MPAKSDLMAGVLQSYGEKLKDPRWQRYRLEIMRRDDFACRLCGDKTTTLNIHHLKYCGQPWDAPNEFLWTLCADCHTIVSANKIDLNAGLISVRKIQRGDEISIIFIDEDGATFYKKHKAGIGFIAGITHDSLRHLVHDVMNFWLQTDRNHYLTEKPTVTNG